MRRSLLCVGVAVATLIPAIVATTTATAAPVGVQTIRSCAAPAPGYAACFALVRTDLATPSAAGSAAAATPSGYGPADLQSAYALANASATAGVGQTIAIVDAYDAVTAEADLGVYRSTYGLPPCTTANGCFKKVNQTGGATPPRANASWGQETSLDLDMVSAICPNCHTLLVEANSSSLANLGKSVAYAASQGAAAISNSYGGADNGDARFGIYYNQPGSAITVSSGDSGFGVSYPASSQYVTAVGGTRLTRNTSARGWGETVWNGAGSGCSTKNLKPNWQTDTGCAMRTVADVSAVSDPATGVAVYDSTPSGGLSGWLVFGGTSVAAPIIAGVYGLAGNGSTVNYGSYPYSHRSGLFDVTSGKNGACGSYLCTGRVGYDGPTGLGTPNGTTGF